MNWADFAILGIVALSAVISILRGFVKEALSLATWVVALWAAFTFFEELAPVFEKWIAMPSARLAVAFVVLFLVVLITGAILNYIVSQLVQKTGLTGTDRVMGVLFGIARGAVIIAILVLLAGLTALPQDSWWQESQLIGRFEELAVWLRGLLPEELASNIRFRGESD